jgi:hypothetical protein
VLNNGLTNKFPVHPERAPEAAARNFRPPLLNLSRNRQMFDRIQAEIETLDDTGA